MPAKGKHHHLSHHHHHHQSQQQQQHQQHPQHQQHLVNVHQSGGAGASQTYNTVVATTRGYVSHAGSDFHVPGQSYGAQAGGQVGGGGGNIGVSGARGPPSLGNIQSIGQSTQGIQSGSGATGGQQQQPQVLTPGVQQQQSLGPVPTTTPPVHTPSPQEMGKPVHHQTQPPSLQQSYLPNQARPVPPAFYQMGPRPGIQSRNSAHRSNQGGGATHVVGMQSIGGNSGQPSTMYPHHTNLNVSGTPTMFVQGQVPNIHTGPHQSQMYPVNSQMPQIAFTSQHRHQTHQSQHFFTSYPAHTLLPPNMFPFTPGPTAPLTAFCYPTHHPPNTAMNLTRANANTVSGGPTHVGGPLVGVQTNAGTQSTLQQPTQQPHTIPPMAISLSQSAYAGHNGGVSNSLNSTYQKVTVRANAIIDIVNPETGLNVAEDIYRDAATTNDESTSREAPAPQDSAIVAEFASRVAKAASESSDTSSNLASSSIQENHQKPPLVQSNTSNQNVQNAQKSQSNCRDNVPGDLQCNLNPPIQTETTINSVQLSSESTYSIAPVADTSSPPVTIKDVRASCETPHVDNPIVSQSGINKDDETTIKQSIVAQSSNTDQVSKSESHPRDHSLTKDFQTTTAVNEVSIPTSTSVEHHSSKESYPAPKSSSRSPSRPRWRDVHKQQQQHHHQQPQLQSQTQTAQQSLQQDQISNSSVASSINTCAPEIIPNEVEQEDSKTGEKINSSTSSAAHNHHVNQQKANGEPSGDKSEFETGAQVDSSQKSTDEHWRRDLRSLKMSEWTNNGSGGATSNSRSTSRNRRPPRDHGKAMQKQKSKNKLRGRDLNRKGAEKEGTDMDAFVNQSMQPLKPEDKAQEHEKESVSGTTVIAGNVDKHQQSEKKLETLPQRMDSIESTKVESETKSEAKPDVEFDQKLVDRSPSHQQSEQILSKPNESINKEMPKNDQSSLIEEKTISVENYNEKSQDLTLTIEDSNKCVQLSDKNTNDVVDHVKISDAIDVEAVVAQKNEENVKVSAGHRESNVTNSSSDEVASDADKQNDNEQINQADSIPKATKAPSLKYQYNSYQWSPQNTSGKKEYDREFLMKLQDDPQSRIRPSNLPDLEVVLKDCTRQSVPRNTIDMRMYKDNRAHEQLFPLFAKPSFNPKLPPPTKKSYQGKSKASKPNVIHLSLSLREDVKLRETENAWKPARLKDVVASEDDIKTQALYKKVRSVLNKLTPQKFDTLVNQVRSLDIDTQGRLQGVIDLVFEKAIDEPGFSVAYALMCKELCHMQVTSTDKSASEETEANYDFRKLLVTRCQMEFEKNAVDEMARITKVREIEQCVDSDKKKELQALLDEADRQMRMRSVGNIRFIGELYKQEMLTAKIMHKCINHLLHGHDEENLECLCKLLTTIGKIFESKQHDLSGYFITLSELTNRKSNKKISSRVRFMIQDVIDLRNSRWVPRRDESNPKTMDQIQKEAESERIEIQLNNTPRKDDRNNLRKHNRNIGPGMNDGWSPPVGKPRALSIETSKLNTKTPPMDNLTLGHRNLYVWNSAPTAEKPNTIGTPNKFAILGDPISLDQDKRPSLPLSGSRSTGSREYRSDFKYTWEGRGSRNGSSHQMSSSSSKREGSLLENSRSQSNPIPLQSMKSKPAPAPMANISSNVQTTKPPKTEEQLIAIFKGIVDKSNLMPNTESFIDAALETIHDHFDNSSFPKFVRNIMDTVLERSAQVRHRISVLLSHLINNNMISLSLVQDEYDKVIEIADDLVIDIPKCWTYFAEILSDMVVLGAHPLSELKRTLAVLRVTGNAGKLLGELLTKLAKDQGPKWVTDKWNQSGIEWNDIINKDYENVENIIQKYNLEFMINGCTNPEKFSSGENLSLDKIHDHLLKLMRDSNFDNITSWIAVNVGDRSKQPQFIRILITAILEVSIEPYNDSWRLNSESLNNLLPLITRYVDTVPQLELQCLYAVQAYMHKLMHPQGVLSSVIDALCEGGMISDDAFLAWHKSTDPAEVQGHAISVKALTSFFVSLQEARDESGEEA